MVKYDIMDSMKQMFIKKIYLYVPYEDKQIVKRLDGKWCPDNRLWYIEYEDIKFLDDNSKELIEKYGKKKIKENIENDTLIHKIYLYVPFNDKDEVKKQGAKFDFQKKLWYIENENENINELLEKYGTEMVMRDKIYLKSYPFKYNNFIRQFNGKYYVKVKKWYVYNQ